MADLDSAFKATERKIQESRKAIDDRKQRQQDDDRSVIAKSIIKAFTGMVIAVVAATILGTYLLYLFGSGNLGQGGYQLLLEQEKFLSGIIGSVMLPIVTLVIGYYFGKK